MKIRELLLMTFVSFGAISLSACNQKNSFTVKWLNYDGETLEIDFEVPKGTLPTYDSARPAHFDDKSNYYVFKGWEPEVGEIKKDMTYTAQFEAHSLTSIDEQPDGYVDVLPTNSNDGIILQAFNWTFKDIKHNLPYIADSGFKVVQTSPVQTPKSNGSTWWAFYQPLSFSIAKESPLGTKEELEDLCTVADEYGISIIVDTVFNHLANNTGKDYEADGTPVVSPLVDEYEHEIYELRNDASNPTFHHNLKAEGSGAETQHYSFDGGLPDLNTGHPLVQARALSFLKECIDIGVDGFRFDAAKHIETPDDPNYPSSFWPNTLGVAKEYYKEKTGKDLLAYGEILGNPTGRNIDVYTKYMKVTETTYSDAVINGTSGRSAKVCVNAKYGKKTDETNLVTWGESHDTYVSSLENKPWSDSFMERVWAIVGSRINTQSMFLARSDKVGSVGIIANYEFKNENIAVVNRFHNKFHGGEEHLSSDGATFVNEVNKGTSDGAVVVSLTNSNKVVVEFETLDTGVYYDQLTGKSVTVRNGHANIEMDPSGISVLTKSKNALRPSFEIDNRGGAFVDSLTINITAKNGTECSYQVNGGDKVAFTGSAEITLTKSQAVEGKVALKISVKNEQFSVEEEFYYNTVELIEGYFNVVNVNEDYISGDYVIYMWSWKPNENGKWSKDYTISGNTLLIENDFVSQLDGFVLGLFAPKDYVPADSNEWDVNVKKQTVNISGDLLTQGYYDASNF